MAKYPSDELHDAHEHFARVSDECAASADYNAFAHLFTEDCTYVEHVFGEMHRREAVRQWIVPLMKLYPNAQLWSREEDVYNTAHFGTLLTEWQAAKDKADA